MTADALPDASASSCSNGGGGGGAGRGKMKGWVEDRMSSQPPLQRQRLEKLPVWPPREGIEDGKGLPIVELPDVSVWS